MKPGSRESDEKILAWVRLRAAGASAAKIAKRYGVAGPTVTIGTVAVMKADLAESGETETTVRRSYWS